jgi:hypothetical protein
MFTIAPIYVVAAIAGAVQSAPGGTLTGCEVVESFEREVHARAGSTLTGAEADGLLAGAAVLRASLCAAPAHDQLAARAA